jgi:hypothetical protein
MSLSTEFDNVCLDFKENTKSGFIFFDELISGSE